jgi:transmembrane sensor
MVSDSDMGGARAVVSAEAAAWVARLQGPDRTPAAEAAFKEWLHADVAHARAFARATDVWDVLPGAARLSRRKTFRAPIIVPALIAASLAVLAGAPSLIQALNGSPNYRTKIGEQQTVALSDGTHVVLNTDSRVSVDYEPRERHVRLIQGEALFEVAKNPSRPFIVLAGDEQVRALGTTFVVRVSGGRVAVTLIEGRVEVTRTRSGAPPAPLAILRPGERLRVSTAADNKLELDHPKIDGVTAWRRGQALFDDISLADAAAELRRYGGPPIEIGDSAVADLRVSGVFATDDPEEFANDMAALYGLKVRRTEQGLELTR